MAYANTFMRKEVKYLLSETEYAAVRSAMASHMTEDKYGKHTICSLYCDSENSDLIRRSLDKPVYKEKLRLRTYGVPSDDSRAFLEIKKKFKGVVYKRRVELSYKELFDYISAGVRPELKSQVMDEIDNMLSRCGLVPKMVICYDRRAFFGNDDVEFRITFDGNIRSRTDMLDLRSGDGGKLVEGQPFRVMEIKSAGAVPIWLCETLSRLKIYPGSFSKYGSAYAAEIQKGISADNDRRIDICSQVS